MNINFQGPVNAGSMIVAAGDVTVGGDVTGALANGAGAGDLVRELRAAVGALELPSTTRTQTTTHLRALEKEVDRPQPDKASMAGRLGKLTAVLQAAGAFATGGAGVIPIIVRLATWLGEHGKAVVAMLPTAG